MKLFFGSMLACLLSVCCFSQEDTVAKTMDKVVMTAQRSKQKELLVPYAVKSIDQKYFSQMQPRTTPEALAGMNGVFVQKTNHGGGSPFVRGLTGNQLLFLVDGIRLNNATFRYGPNQYLNTIDAYTINKIEVAKGTGSVQYGTDALGGVINVITNEPLLTNKKIFTGRGIVKYMTGNMEKTIRGDAGYSTKKFAIIGGITARDFGDVVGGDTTGRQSPSGYKEWSFDVKAKWLLTTRTELIVANQFLQQSNVPVYHKLQLENFAVNEMHRQQRRLSYARLRFTGDKNLLKETEITASWQQTVEGRNSRKHGSNFLRKETDQVSSFGFTIDNLSQIKNYWTANSGIEFYNDDVKSIGEDINIQNGMKQNKRGLYPNNSGYGNYSIYSLHHFSLKKWIVDAGLRYNFFSIKIFDTTLGKVNIHPSAFVANAAIMYKVFTDHHFYVSYSSGFRAPNVDDMGTLGIVDFRYEVPTGSLKPERSQNIEAGYKFKTKKWKGSVAAYYMHIDDLIARVKMDGEIINGYQVYKKENVEQAFIRGVEAELNWKPVNNFNFTAGVASTYGQNTTKNEPLRRIPPLNGRLLGRLHNINWSIATEFLFAANQSRLAQGDKDDNRIPKGGTPGWKVVNVYSGYQFSKCQINLGLQNIFDDDYRTHGSGINGVGRSAWFSVTIIL